MTSLQLRESTGLSNAELTCWINQGLLVPKRTGAGGRNPKFDADQLPRIHVLKALHDKASPLTFAQKTDSPPTKKSGKKNKKGKHSKTSTKTSSLYKH